MRGPTFFNRLSNWFKSLIARRAQPSQPTPTHYTGAGQLAQVVQQIVPQVLRVSLIIYNPAVPSEGGWKLTDILNWNDPDNLVKDLIRDLEDVSSGYAKYQIAERIEVDEFPVKQDGFQYTPEEYVSLWRQGGPFHQPDAVNYYRILEDHQLVEKVNQGLIDEVWTVSYPWAGFYESRMAGPGAFWCNAPPLEGTNAEHRFVIMAFNYERGVGEMLESYGHRAESIMERVYRRIPEPDNLWKRFTRHDKTHPGRAEVGNIHFAPNSRSDYDWGNRQPVLSRFLTWQRFPDLSGRPVMVDSRVWGEGDTRAHHRWWFSLLPHAPGEMNGISNNWWEYIVDPNRVD